MNTYNFYDEELRCKAKKALQEMKKVEHNTILHKKRINRNTIVFCKNKENIKLYEDIFK